MVFIKSPIKQFKVCVIGPDGVGKTSLILQYIKKFFISSYLPTLGVDFYTTQLIQENEVIEINLWDIASQELFRPLKGYYLAYTHFTLICTDIYRTDSSIIDPWITDLRDLVGENALFFSRGE